MDITRAIDLVRGSGQRHGAGASEAQVRDAEEKLGLALPAAYRAFLARVGWVEADDFVIYGLGEDLPPLLDLVVNADIERSDDPGTRMPPHILPICPDGMGNHDCLDTSREREGDCPVVFWGQGTGPALGAKGERPTFAAWLAERFADLEAEAGGSEAGSGRRGSPGRRGSSRGGRAGEGEAGRSKSRRGPKPYGAADEAEQRARRPADPRMNDLAAGPDAEMHPPPT